MRVAVTHQAVPPPAVDGIFKPPKPGGYKDSSSDIAYALKQAGIDVALPDGGNPDPASDEGWSFPDTAKGLLSAIKDYKADVIYLNTTLFNGHPLTEIAKQFPDVRIVGQRPQDQEKYDDKQWCNTWLASHKELKDSFATTRLVKKGETIKSDLGFPVIIKPVRGRGSYGVKLIHNQEELQKVGQAMFEENGGFYLEEYLTGEEITLSVIPPGVYDPPIGEQESYYALPVVTRYNHVDGIAPYSGLVAVTANSHAISQQEAAKDRAYAQAQRAAEAVAARCKVLGTIRVDARRSKPGSPFKLFDVNLKPNATGPGRPGREQQLSLTGLAAKQAGWDYQTLSANLARNARKLRLIL